MKRLLLFSLVVVVVIGMMFSGCGPDEPVVTPPTEPEPEPEKTPWEELVEAAQAEGTVTLYIEWGAPSEQAIKEGFEAAYGITVETIGGPPPVMQAKITEEQIAGVYVCDVYAAGAETLSQFMEEGYTQPLLQPLPSLEDKDVFLMDPTELDSEMRSVVVLYGPNAGLLINTDMVTEDITSANDLLDPKWKGELVMTDPRIGGPGQANIFSGMVLGEDYWMDFAEQEPLLEKNHQRPIDAVALGEKPIAFGFSNSRAMAAMDAGAPVKLVHIEDYTLAIAMAQATTKNAPHPNAATLLIDWMLSAEGQAAVCQARGTPSFRTDVMSDWVPEGARWEDAYNLVPGPFAVGDSQTAKDFAISIFGPL
jgi:iron(III) transport system substrate-binding protein